MSVALLFSSYLPRSYNFPCWIYSCGFWL